VRSATVQSRRRPRVGIVAHGIHDDGGMERAFAELIRRTHERYELVVFSSDLDEGLRRLVEWRRVRVPRRPAPLRFALFYVLGALRLARADLDLVHTLGAIVPNGADLASVHFCNAGFVERVGTAPPNAPVTRRLNTTVARLLGVAAERWSYRRGRTARLAPVSPGVAREVERHYAGVPVLLAPNGVDRGRFHPDEQARAEVRSELGIAADEIVALFVGGDWHLKGLAVAIEATAIASRERREPLRLLVVGRGDVRLFRRLAEAHGIGAHVVFMGARKDTERFFAAADLFVLPTAYETFSLAAFEAAATGLPIVATRVHGVEELVGDGAAGIPVERDAREVAAAVAALAASPELRRRLGAAARARSEAFTWERSAEAVEGAYRELLTGDGGRDAR